MIEFLTLVVLLAIYAVIRLFHLTSLPAVPTLYYRQPCSEFMQAVLKACPILHRVYHPPLLWGKSGHIQTIIYAKLGRVIPKFPEGERHHYVMPDGATMSFDVYDPHEEGKEGRAKFTLAICPGIANSSESSYIRTFVSYAQTHGFRVAVLNHLGALNSEKLSAPRIFTYGGTDEYGVMIDKLQELYPDSQLMAVGFSMGANIVTKYLGENKANQSKVLCGMSVCQGYEVNRAKELFLQWAHLRRVYTFVMTLHQTGLLKRHHNILFGEDACQMYGKFDEEKVFAATSLDVIDDHYSSKRAGFGSLQDYYHWCSSAYYMQNIDIPMLFMNAEDDPICPVPLLNYPRELAEKKDKVLFMTTKHGGHLGYFEHGYIVPDHFTWLDRVLVEYADAVVDIYLHGNLTTAGTSSAVPSENNVNTERVRLESSKTGVKEKSGETSGTLDDKDFNKNFHDNQSSGSNKPNLIHNINRSDKLNCDTKVGNDTKTAEEILHQNAALVQ